MHTWHLMARQGDQHWCPVSHWPPHHVHPAETMLAVLAWPCLPYGGLLNSKRHPLQRAYLRAEKHWLPTAEVQGCIQERHEGTWHQHQFLGGPCHRPHQLEKHTSQTAADWQKEADSCGSREVNLQKGNGSQQTRVNAQMQPIQPRLPISHWSLQPQEALLKPSRQPGQVTDRLSSSMVSHDWQRPMCVCMWRLLLDGWLISGTSCLSCICTKILYECLGKLDHYDLYSEQ